MLAAVVVVTGVDLVLDLLVVAVVEWEEMDHRLLEQEQMEQQAQVVAV
tara:strand:+ start:896 stop:1039 length:144 start_codon:yes stop_codon:yes gene_type:complete